MTGGAARRPAVLVTGAARGLGEALAREYRDRGWEVLAPGRAELDVGDEASVAAYAAALDGRPLDLLVNNAGVRLTGGADRLGGYAQAAFLETLRINTVGPALVTQALLPALRRGQGRKVISLSSRLGSLAGGGGENSGGSDASYAAYRVSKTALNQVNRCLAAELGDEGFACVVLSPGRVQTGMGGAGAGVTADEAARDIVALVDRIGPADNGAFLDRMGAPVPW